MKLSDNIKTIRKSKGVTQMDMAEKLGVGQSNYTYLENRGEKLTVEQLDSIAVALGVTVVELLTGEPQTGQTDERVKELEAEVKNEKEMREYFRDKSKEYNLVLTNYFRELVFKEAVKAGEVSPELGYFDIYKYYKNIDVKKIYKEVLSKDVLLTRLIKRGLFGDVNIDIKEIQIEAEKETIEEIKKEIQQNLGPIIQGKTNAEHECFNEGMKQITQSLISLMQDKTNVESDKQ